MNELIETLAKALAAAQFPSTHPDYAWRVQDSGGKNEYRAAARLAVHHLDNACGCRCTPSLEESTK